MSVPTLEIRGLEVGYSLGHRRQTVLRGVDLTLEPGRLMAVVGESGSGKSTIAQAVLGLLPANGRREAGSIRLNGTEIAGWSDRRLGGIRGRVMSLVPQDPTMSLNPVRRIGSQIAEILQRHRAVPRQDIPARVDELLRRVGLPDTARIAHSHPHQLSGGMKQRVLIAIAIALAPSLIIADEPTSGLDATVQRQILDLIDALRRETGTSVLLITHDLGIAAERSDSILVLESGRVQESGPTAAVLAAPQSGRTRRLLADNPVWAPAPPRPAPRPGPPAIEIAGLSHDYRSGAALHTALSGVGFVVPPGTTHALVGESGSGKSTLARIVAGFIAPQSGTLRVAGAEPGRLDRAGLRGFRRKVQLVHQNPWASLDPRQTLRQIVLEPLRNFPGAAGGDARARVEEVLDRVGLPAALFDRRPAALSGGQRQRVAIARAVVLRPEVLVLDEAVSALDVSIQAQILGLLRQLQDDLGLTYLFVSHDLAVVRQLADSLSVISAGRIEETGPTEAVLAAPQSATTRALLAAVPGRGRRPGASPFLSTRSLHEQPAS